MMVVDRPTTVIVDGMAVPVVEAAGERLITFGMVDQVHSRPKGTARRNFGANRERFEEGRHFRRISAHEIRSRFPELGISPRATEDITALTERGYLRLVKSFGDDLAWDVQERLVDAYFKAAARAPSTLVVPADYAAALRLAADSVERETRAQERVAELEPQSEALALLTEARGSLNLTEASKALGTARAHLIEVMQRHRWIYRRGGAAAWLGYSDKVEQGLLTHKVDTIELRGGAQQMVEQVRVTAKGVTKLAILIGGCNG